VLLPIIRSVCRRTIWNTPDPASGTIEKDPGTGEPNGVLVEAACRLVKDVVPPWPFETRAACYKETMKTYNSGGLTSIVNGITDPESLKVFKHLWNGREATLRVSLMYCPTGEEIPSLSLKDWEEVVRETAWLSGTGDDWFNVSGIKFISDGGMTLRTAYLREPYPDDSSYYGTSLIPQERLNQLVAICNRHNWRVGIHAIGDAAIDKVLDAYEYANREKPISGRRFILLHGSLMLPEQMRRARRLGVFVSVANAFMWLKSTTTERFIGRERADRACPTRWMIDHMGIENVGAGPDFPINTYNPFVTMYVMITRKDSRGVVYGGNQAITREEAVRLYTNGPARYTFEENIKGSIEAGKLADLVVISDDLLTCPEATIKDIKAVMTVVNGEIVYQV
jgi:predicted amidohydrolase YtcJ